MSEALPRVGTTCAYAPLALLDAAGAAPYRILPYGDAPDQAGRLLHDNLCAHVRRVLDRALAEDVPPLAGLVVVGSCDAMRRLAEGWPRAVPKVPCHLLDLPMRKDDLAVGHFARELRLLGQALETWTGQGITDAGIREAAAGRDALADAVATLDQRAAAGTLPGGRARLQALLNGLVTTSLSEACALTEAALAEAARPEEAPPAPGAPSPVPVYLFGNVLAAPEALALIEGCGARVVGEDLCTGLRQLARLDLPAAGDPYLALSGALLGRPPCARTLPASPEDTLERQVVTAARAAGARGVIGHAAKFCDPYLARMPRLREACRGAGLPLLLLEGDASLRTLGQQATRIEAFVEMLG